MGDDYPDSQDETKRKKIYKAMRDRIVHVYNNLKADIRDEESKGSKYKDYMKEISELVDKIPTRPIIRGEEEDELEGVVNSGSELFAAASSLGRATHENAENPLASHGDAAAGSTQRASLNAASVRPVAHLTAAAGLTQGASLNAARVQPGAQSTAAAGSTQGENPNAASVWPGANPNAAGVRPVATSNAAARPVENTTPSSSAPKVSGNNDTFFTWLPSWIQPRKTAAATDPKAAATDPKPAAAAVPKAAAAAVQKAAAATVQKVDAAAVSNPSEQPPVTSAALSQGLLNLFESDDRKFRGTLKEVLAYEQSDASQQARLVAASQPATIVDPAETEETVAFGSKNGELLQDNAILNADGDLNQLQGKKEGGFAFSAKHKPPLVTKNGTIRFLDSTRPTSSAATASKNISKTKALGGKFTKKETIAKSHSKKITFNVKSKRPTKKTIKKEIKFKVGASQ
jgi:uncharacterized protein (DUF1330 family)